MSIAESEAKITPKVFISYSWTSPEYEARVVSLVESLIKNGVDVVFDKYDLAEGADLNSYMERMVNDETISKVLILCDSRYKEKANKRDGGVGTEALIISPELYNQVNPSGTNQKFIPIVMERDLHGNPYLPTYLSSRKYIDLSPDSEDGFEQLLRYVHGMPLYQRPELGSPPAFIMTIEGVTLGTTNAHSEALKSLKIGKPNSLILCEDFFDLFLTNLERFRLDKYDDDLILQNINDFIHARNEFVDIVVAHARGDSIKTLIQPLRRFFERIYNYTQPHPQAHQYTDGQFDHFKYLANECFLYTVATLLRYEKFDLLPEFLADYYLYTFRRQENGLKHYTAFYFHLKSLEIRKERLKLDRYDLQCDLINKHATRQDLNYSHIMQADFFLYFYAVLHGLTEYGFGWYPRTLLYAGYMDGPLEVFARASSLKYFNRFKEALSIEDTSKLHALRTHFAQNQQDNRLRFGYDHRSISALSNLDKIASAP